MLKEQSEPHNICREMGAGFDQVIAELKEIRRNVLRPMKETKDVKDREKAINLEWEYIASVVDRIFLILFMGVLISAVSMFLVFGMSHSQEI